MLSHRQSGAPWPALKRLAEIRIGRRLPLFSSLFVTGRCNSACRGCFFFEAIRTGPQDMETDLAIACAAQLGEAGVPVCFVVGGEPLLHPDLAEIGRALRRCGVMPMLFTNGRLLDAGNVSAVLDSFQRIFFSIDGLEQSDDARRGPGSFAASIAAIERCLACDPRAPVFVRCVIDAHNALEAAAFAGAMRDKGVRAVSFQPDSYRESLPLGRDGGGGAASLREAKAVHGSFVLESASEIAVMARYLETGKTPACRARELAHVSVFPDGVVSACCEQLLPFGNLRDAPLVELLGKADGVGPVDRCHGCCRTDQQLAMAIACGTATQVGLALLGLAGKALR